MGVRLSEDDAWAVIESAHTGILTTLRADGAPISLPVWFAVIDRTIGMSTPSRAKKVARVRSDPRAAFLVESGKHWAELQAVHLNGTAHVVDEEPARARILAALAAKYAAFRTAPSALPAATRDHYAERTVLRFVPEARILSWDNRRLRLKNNA